MEILLTGYNGFLGRVLYKSIASGNHVKTLSRSSGDYIVDLSKERPVFGHRFDIVVHAAGLAHISANASKNGEFNSVNFVGTENLLKGLELSEIPDQFVLISSVAVYGRQTGILIGEKDKLMAYDSYGKSKIDAEKLVMKWCKKNNVTCTILRLPLVVGCNPPGNLGAMIKGIKENRYFNVAGGFPRKSMVLAQDVAEFILKAAEVGGIYNLTDGYHPSFKELSYYISLQLGKREPRNLPKVIARLVAKVGDFIGSSAPLNSEKLLKMTSELTFDDSKARNKFGWNPTPVLDGFIISEKKQ